MFQTFHRLAVSTSVAIALTSISAFTALAQEATAPMHGGDQMQKMHSAMQKSATPSAKPRGGSGNQPYAGMEKRKSKALSEDRIEGLLSGKGI